MCIWAGNCIPLLNIYPVESASCLKGLSICVMVLVLEKHGSFSVLSPTGVQSCDPNEMSRVSSLLAAAGKCPVNLSFLLLWTRRWDDAFRLLLRLPKEIVLHRMFSWLPEEGGETA